MRNTAYLQINVLVTHQLDNFKRSNNLLTIHKNLRTWQLWLKLTYSEQNNCLKTFFDSINMLLENVRLICSSLICSAHIFYMETAGKAR
jgi:hypothetical protein